MTVTELMEVNNHSVASFAKRYGYREVDIRVFLNGKKEPSQYQIERLEERVMRDHKMLEELYKREEYYNVSVGIAQVHETGEEEYYMDRLIEVRRKIEKIKYGL